VKKKKLLVADDEKNLRLLYQMELEQEGYAVTVACDAQEVLELLKKQQFDLVILDILMPGMNGIELTEKILAKDKRQKIILNTAYSAYKDNFMTWAADAYVVKSGDLTELKTRIREVLATP